MKPDFELNVGDVVRVKVACLGNPRFSLGIVYDTYRSGVDLIMENGNTSGWSFDEFSTLEKLDVKSNISITGYEFKTAGQLNEDYRLGKFKFDEVYAQLVPSNPTKISAVEKLIELYTDVNSRAMQDPENYAVRRLQEINITVLAMIETIKAAQRASVMTPKEIHEIQESDRRDERWLHQEHASEDEM